MTVIDTNNWPVRQWNRVDSYEATALHPKVGTVWVWEVSKPAARCLVQVTDVKWNGEEWWVECEQLTADGWRPAGVPTFDKRRHWNDLSRFMEACLPVVGTLEALMAACERSGGVADG